MLTNITIIINKLCKMYFLRQKNLLFCNKIMNLKNTFYFLQKRLKGKYFNFIQNCEHFNNQYQVQRDDEILSELRRVVACAQRFNDTDLGTMFDYVGVIDF